MPALQRARRRLRPGRALHPGRARRRRLGRDRPEGLDQSYAHLAAFGILLARTDPDAPKHAGISYFICPMDAPGSTVRPIVDMTGDHAFNEVFLDDVRLPPSEPGRQVNGGWALAKVTLGNERVSLSGGGALWGQGPTAATWSTWCATPGRWSDPQSASGWPSHGIDGEILRLIRLRTVQPPCRVSRRGPRRRCARRWPTSTARTSWAWPRTWPEPAGMLAGRGPAGHRCRRRAFLATAIWSQGFLFAPALTIGGGTPRCSGTSSESGPSGFPAIRRAEGSAWPLGSRGSGRPGRRTVRARWADPWGSPRGSRLRR